MSQTVPTIKTQYEQQLTGRITEKLLEEFKLEANATNNGADGPGVKVEVGDQFYKELAEFEGLSIETINKVHALDGRFMDIVQQAFGEAVISDQKAVGSLTNVYEFQNTLRERKFRFSAFRSMDIDDNDTYMFVEPASVRFIDVTREPVIRAEVNARLEALYRNAMQSI